MDPAGKAKDPSRAMQNGKQAAALQGQPTQKQLEALSLPEQEKLLCSQLPAAKEALEALERDEGGAKEAQQDLSLASAALPDPTRDLNERDIDTLRKQKANSATVTVRHPAGPRA